VKVNLTHWKWWRVDAPGAAVLVVLAVIVYACGYHPLMRSHREYLTRQGELAAQHEHAARLEGTLVALQKRLGAARETAEAGSLNLKPSSSLNSQLTQISALAAQSGLVLADVRTGPVAPQQHCEAFPVSLAGAGTYRACTVFLAELKRAFPDTTVQSVDLAASGIDRSGMGKFALGLRWHAAKACAARQDAAARG